MPGSFKCKFVCYSQLPNSENDNLLSARHQNLKHHIHRQTASSPFPSPRSKSPSPLLAIGRYVSTSPANTPPLICLPPPWYSPHPLLHHHSTITCVTHLSGKVSRYVLFPQIDLLLTTHLRHLKNILHSVLQNEANAKMSVLAFYILI